MSLLLASIRKAEIANKGKKEEKQVEEVLAAIKSQLYYVDYARRPDARACMGRIGPQPSDFECVIDGQQYEIEVKSTKSVNTIPYKNFSQLGMLRRKRMCKVKVIVLIYRAKKKAWCMPSFDLMLDNYNPDKGASWNLADIPLHENIAELLTEALGLGHLLK